jgi:hypothetical protein
MYCAFVTEIKQTSGADDFSPLPSQSLLRYLGIAGLPLNPDIVINSWSLQDKSPYD